MLQAVAMAMFIVNWWTGTVHAGVEVAGDCGDKSIPYNGAYLRTACRRRIGANPEAYRVDETAARANLCGLKECRAILGRSNDVGCSDGGAETELIEVQFVSSEEEGGSGDIAPFVLGGRI